MDIEEGLAEEKKGRDSLSKDLEALHKKAKVIEAGVKSAETELEAFQVRFSFSVLRTPCREHKNTCVLSCLFLQFQLEKQQKLNELDVVVTLKLHQIQHTVNNLLPADLSECLIFESQGLVSLQQRIQELELEKSSQKKQHK